MEDLIGGLDEVGYGSLSGPLVIVVAAFPNGKTRPLGCQDSKKTSRTGREKVLPSLYEAAAFVGVGWASADFINDKGVAEAWQVAANRAMKGMPELEKLVVDGSRHVRDYDGNQMVIPKADTVHWQVSAASIIAKHIRDVEMEELAVYYPGYDWENNSGYGSEAHRKALVELGPTPEHRNKYIRKIVNPKKGSRFK